KDFVEGAQVPYRDAKGATYGYSWEGGAMVMGLSRMDLMEKKGLKIPKTFAELQQVCAEMNGTDGVTGLVSFQLHHWCLPPYIQGKGKDTAPGGPMPGRPGRQFPAANRQGVRISKNAKNKKAAWEFIKWALSPEISMRLVKEHGHSSVCRRSVIESEEYRKL